MKPFRLISLFTLVLAAPVASRAGPPRQELLTEFERSGGTRSGTYAQTMELTGRLERASDWVRTGSFGTSPEGRSLPLVIVDRHRRFTPERAHAPGNVVVLVQAGIHAGEIDGKDAGMMLVREMAVERSLSALLDHVTLLFIPIYNVDGHERTSRYNRANQNGPEVQGFRTTAGNLNLNRDYMKADAPETRCWLSLFNSWKPDFFIDCHVTDGADYQYVVTYLMETWQSADPAIAAWTSDRFLPPLETRMEEAGLPLSPYCAFRKDNDPTSGLQCGPSTPRFSTGYVALRNRPALLIETHMIKDYATRVRGTHEMIRHSLAAIDANRSSLLAAIAEADARTTSGALRGSPFPVTLQTSFADSVMVDFLGVDYTRETSDVTGGTWVRFTGTPRTFRIPYFPHAVVTASVDVPAAYIIPPQWTSVIERLQAHGATLRVLRDPTSLAVSSVRFSGVTWASTPFEGRHALKYHADDIEETRAFPAGSVVVDTAQPLGKVIVHLLEPAAPDALVRWGLLDATFEQKEYIESYVMEAMIRNMLAADPALKARFRAAMADTAFAHDPERIRHWFYTESPYFDRQVGLYPIARIRDRAVLASLALSKP